MRPRFGTVSSPRLPMSVLARLLTAVVVLAALSPVSAQTYEPERGSAERTAILEAVRAETRTQHSLSGRIVFFDVSMRVQGPWAYFSGDPRRPDGGDPGHCDPEWDSHMIALLYRSGGRWHVLEAGACASDVWFLHWPARFGAPAAVVGFGMSQPFPLAAEVAQTSDGYLSLRTQPSVRSGSRLARMPSGAQIRVLGCQTSPQSIGGTWGRWCQVNYGRKSGWAFSAYVVMY